MHGKTLAALATLALALMADPASAEDRAQNFLVRPAEAVDTDALGRVRIATNAEGDDQFFEVQASKIDTAGDFELFMQSTPDGDGLSLVGALELLNAGSNGSERLLRRTKVGDELPFGAASVTEFLGRRVEVRQGDAVIIGGRIPTGFIESKAAFLATTSLMRVEGGADDDGDAAEGDDDSSSNGDDDSSSKGDDDSSSKDDDSSSKDGDDDSSKDDDDASSKGDDDSSSNDDDDDSSKGDDDSSSDDDDSSSDGDDTTDDDGDASGMAVVLSRPADGRERFGVIVDGVDIDSLHELWLGTTPGGDETQRVADLERAFVQPPGDDDDGDDGEVSKLLKLDTKKGDELPFDVSDNDDLLGRDLQVRADGDVILVGTIPDHWSGPSKNLKAKAALKRADGGDDDNAEGRLDLRQQNHIDRSRFDVKVQHVRKQADHEVWIRDGQGDFAYVAELNVGNGGDDGIDNEGRLTYATDSKEGEGLPLDLAFGEDLLDRRVEIRAGDRLVLVGRLPEEFVEKLTTKQTATTDVEAVPGSPDADAGGRLKLRRLGRSGAETFALKVGRLDFERTTYRVAVETSPESDTFVLCGEMDRRGTRTGRFQCRTKRGESLPLGVLQIEDLAGRRVRIVDDGGQTAAEALIPGF